MIFNKLNQTDSYILLVSIEISDSPLLEPPTYQKPDRRWSLSHCLTGGQEDRCRWPQILAGYQGIQDLCYSLSEEVRTSQDLKWKTLFGISLWFEQSVMFTEIIDICAFHVIALKSSFHIGCETLGGLLTSCSLKSCLVWRVIFFLMFRSWNVRTSSDKE